MTETSARSTLHSRIIQQGIVVAFCLGLSVLIYWPILATPSWYNSYQAYRYPYLLAMFRDEFLNGYWYPRWLPELAGGYGYPTFVYYSPGFWFMALPFALLFTNILLATKAAYLSILIIGGIGAYRLARCFCPRKYAFVSTALFYLTPYFSMNLYLRGDLSENMAAMLCPWVFYFLVTLTRKVQLQQPCMKAALGLGISLAAIVYSHPLIAVWMGFALIICMLGAIAECKNPWRMLAIAAAVAALALALSAAYWFPALTLHSYVQYQNIGQGGQHMAFFSFLYLYAIMEYFGMPLMAVLGMAMHFRSHLIKAMLLCNLCLFIFMTPLFPLQWREQVGIFYYLQFPFRVLCILATLQLIGVSLLLGNLPPRLHWRDGFYIGIIIATLMIATAFIYRHPVKALDYFVFNAEQQLTFANMTHTNEFTPTHADLKGLQVRKAEHIPIALVNDAPLPLLFNHGDTDIAADLTTHAKNTRIIINQFQFPGWNVEVGGVPTIDCQDPRAISAPSSCAGPNGRILIVLPEEGDYHMHVWYEGVPGAGLRNSIALMVAILSIVALCKLCYFKTSIITP